MNSNRVLQLVDLLASVANDRQEELAQIYKQAVCDSDEYMALKNSLDTHVFYGEYGNGLLTDGRGLLEKMFNERANIMATLAEASHLTEMIDELSSQADHMIYEMSASRERIRVVQMEHEAKYHAFLNALATVLVYGIAWLQESDQRKNLMWDAGAGISDKLYYINSVLWPRMLYGLETYRAWTVYRAPVRNRIRFLEYEYVLQYMTIDMYQDYINRDGYQQILEHTYINADALQDVNSYLPIYVGIGNLVSTSPQEALRLIREPVIHHIAGLKSSVQLTTAVVPEIQTFMRELAPNMLYVLEPVCLLNLMNQWDICSAVQTRRAAQKCLLCGRDVAEHRKVCEAHFRRSQ